MKGKKMSGNNMVSIITPLYNGEKYIEETIKSVQNQTYKNWEMLIADDQSSDGGADIVRVYAENDQRIKLISLEKNGGAAVARNTAISQANGKYIAFLDSDDLWESQKLEKQIKFMQENKYEFTFTKYRQIKEDGNKTKKYISVPSNLTYRQALLKNPIGCLTVMYDVEKLGKIYMPMIENREDYGLWLKILKSGVVGHGLNECLAYYRLRKNSLSSKKLKLIKYQWKLYRKIENLNVFQSFFYLCMIIIQKVFKIK